MRESRQWFYSGLFANCILLVLSVLMLVPLAWTDLATLDNTSINVTEVFYKNYSLASNTTALVNMSLNDTDLPLKYQIHLWGYASLGEGDEVTAMHPVSKFAFNITKIYSETTLNASNGTITETTANLPLSQSNLRDLSEAAQNIRDLNLTILIISCMTAALQICGLIFDSSMLLAVFGAFASILLGLIMTLLGLIECLGTHLALAMPIVKHFTSGANLSGITATKNDLVYIPLGFMIPMGCLVGVLAFTGFTFNIGYSRSEGR